VSCLSDKDQQSIYDAVSNRIMDARVAIAKLFSAPKYRVGAVKTIGEEVERVLFKTQDEAAKLAVDVAKTSAERDAHVRDLESRVEQLKKALEKYVSCRHAVTNCNCTTEARAALYPYLLREKAAAQGPS
jgi:hypothetical protein